MTQETQHACRWPRVSYGREHLPSQGWGNKGKKSETLDQRRNAVLSQDRWLRKDHEAGPGGLKIIRWLESIAAGGWEVIVVNEAHRVGRGLTRKTDILSSSISPCMQSIIHWGKGNVICIVQVSVSQRTVWRWKTKHTHTKTPQI